MVEELALSNMKRPIVDLHCDLLSYLAVVPGASVEKSDQFGAAIPHLKAGNVKLQVMAIYTDTKAGSSAAGEKQRKLFEELPMLSNGFFSRFTSGALSPEALENQSGCYAWLAIENGSAFCEEDESLSTGLLRLEQMVASSGPLAYIIITHHYENRFGGGNYSDVGLKADGEVLLDFLDGKRIPVDLAHTSDKLAYGILNYIDKRSLNIPVLASHSNFRKIHSHVRNLPDELAMELIRRNGLIGINFLRNYINDTDPGVLYDHINHGIKLGAQHLLAFGADFFYALNHPDPSRYPIYFQGQDNASWYQEILADMRERSGEHFEDGIAYKNAIGYYLSLK
jgi:membrane dipeptidase